MFPLSCFLVAVSKSKSSSRLPFSTATLVSSGWAASINMRFAIRQSLRARHADPCEQRVATCLGWRNRLLRARPAKRGTVGRHDGDRRRRPLSRSRSNRLRCSTLVRRLGGASSLPGRHRLAFLPTPNQGPFATPVCPSRCLGRPNTYGGSQHQNNRGQIGFTIEYSQGCAPASSGIGAIHWWPRRILPQALI